MPAIQDTCVSTVGPVELAVRSFATEGWPCDRCRVEKGARFLDSLWLCGWCFRIYYLNPQTERWR